MASKRRLRRKQRRQECGHKQRHETRAQAVNQKISLQKAGLAMDGEMATYKCKWCGGWHVGHKPWAWRR